MTFEELKKANKYEEVIRILKEMSSETDEVDIIVHGESDYLEDKLEWSKLDKQRTNLIEMIESNKDIRHKEAENLQDLFMYALSEMALSLDRHVDAILGDKEADEVEGYFTDSKTWLEVAKIIEIAGYQKN